MSSALPGRRAVRRSRRRPDGLAVVAGALLAAAGGLLVAADALEPTAVPPARSAAVPVQEVTTVCAAPRGMDVDVQTLSAPLQVTADGADGALLAGPVGGRLDPVDDDGRGRLTTLSPPAAGSGPGDALSVSATGGPAVGRATFTVGRATDAAAVQECLAPRARWWFTGAAASIDHTSTLVVANTDPGPAVVDLTVLGPDGPVETARTRGIALAPGEVRSIGLVEIAPQVEEVAVHVEASRGRVVAAVADRFATGPDAQPGREWLPAQTGPSRVLRLAPLPQRADRRTLVVANPTGREALAEVQVVGESGTFVPAELAQLRVPPQSVVTADLGQVLTDEAASVVVRSGVRLTGTVRSTRDTDVAYSAATPWLGGPAAVALPRGLRATVQLSAAGDATVRAVAYSADGEEVDRTRLRAAAGTTVAWRPERGAYLVVWPEAGRTAGGVVLAGGAGAAALPLRPLPVTLRRPAVVPVLGPAVG